MESHIDNIDPIGLPILSQELKSNSEPNSPRLLPALKLALSVRRSMEIRDKLALELIPEADPIPKYMTYELNCRLAKGSTHEAHHATSEAIMNKIVPPQVDLRAKMPTALDQLEKGNSVVNATANALKYYWQNGDGSPLDPLTNWQKEDSSPSRNFIYYNVSQAIKNTGLSVADGFKSVVKYGACPEDMWPYATANTTAKTTERPSKECNEAAVKNPRVTALRVVYTLAAMKHCLAEGHPFVFAFRAYASFTSDEVAKTGMVPMPKNGDQFEGNHCAICCGYSDKTKRFLCQNIWGPTWGMNGYFEIPYDYLASSFLACDFWTFRPVS